jgi:integrase
LQLIARPESLPTPQQSYISASLAKATLRAYKADLAHFRAWGGTLPSTPTQIAQYLADHAAKLSVATLRRRLATFAKAHRTAGFSNPVDSEEVALTLRGIRRMHGKPQRQARALECVDVLRMLPALGSVKAARDRALILVGFAGGFRRSELVALDTEDLRFVDEGLLITLRRSKTDQAGDGRRIAVPYGPDSACPVRSVRDWIERAGIVSGAVFRSLSRTGKMGSERLSPQAVALVLKQYAKRIGLDPELISGHSLRAGLVTSAAKAGASAWKIRQQTGHKSDAMVARYIRDADLFVDNAAARVLGRVTTGGSS